MTSPDIESHIPDTVATKTSDNHTPRTEAAPPANGPIPYPEWSEVVESLIDVFARLHPAGWLPPDASWPVAPTDGQPPYPAKLPVKDALVCMAGCVLPAGLRVDHGFNGLLEAAMALHLRVVLRHNRRERLNGLTQGSEGGNV